MTLVGERRVAYVAYAFPVLTQTFTVREVAALRARGLDVQVFAARRDPGAARDPEAAEEARRAVYLASPGAFGTIAAAVGFLVRRPARFLATLAACLGGGYRDDALLCRLRAPLHFLRGVALGRELRRRGPFGLVHAQFVDAGSTVAFAAARLLDIPFSFANHTAYNPYLLPVKAARAALVVSISDFDRSRVLVDCGRGVEARSVVWRVGFRGGGWASAPRRPELGRVLAVGALREKKGHAVLIRAARTLADRGLRVALRFAGSGPEEGELRRLADELAVDVAFLGALSPAAVRDELARAAVFALPCLVARNGDLDGIPVAVMEAMAAGVPVVSTRVSGIPELIEDGVSGLLAEPADADSLAGALERVLRDGDLAHALAGAGRRRVSELHDLDRTSARLAELLAGAAA